MLSLMTLTLAASLCSGSCRDEELLAPRAVHPFQALLVTSDSLCARITVTVSGTSTVSSTWPSTASCTTNLVLIKGSTPKWAGSTRKLSLFVKLTNNSGGSLQLPIRLYLPATGVTVLTPAGTPASTVVALNPDSSEAGGGRVWFTGGTGTLSNKASTVLDTLLFTLASPASQVRLSFVATANTSGGSGNPPPLPNSTADVPDDSLHIVYAPGDTVAQYYRTIASVTFSDVATAQQISAVLTKYAAQVVGGATLDNTYIIQYADPGPTWAAVWTKLRQIEAEPGVLWATPFARYEPLQVEARFPSDGAGLQRADWLTGTGITSWALRAVRAPQAWGCETGAVVEARTRVGVMEWSVDQTNQDLSPSFTPPVYYSPVGRSGVHALAQDTLELTQHGTAVAGAMTAAGDNGFGVAGSTWRTDLRLYVMRPNNYYNSTSQIDALRVAMSKAADDGLRVLPLAIHIYGTPDTALAARRINSLVRLLKKFMDRSPNTLLVKSAGNDSLQGLTLTAAKALIRNPLLAAFQRLRDSTSAGRPAKKRILIVAGTYPTDTLWRGSTFVSGGGIDIAAPGDNVATLGLAAGGPPYQGEVLLMYGTSSSAPMVAGVAAQLIAMDPTLTPDSVKHYLMQGAAYDIEPNSGILTPKLHSVSGAPETIYQLDAYSSLQQLAWDSPTTPLCGTIMWWDQDSSGVRLLSVRKWDDPIPVLNGLVPPQFPNVSIAQGGRLVAISNLNLGAGPETWEYAKLNGQWTRTNVEAGVTFRTYLERDTADLYNSGGRAVLGKTYPSQTSVDFTSLIHPDSGGALWVQYAPDGLHAIAAGKRLSPCGGTKSFQQAWLVTLPAAGTASSQQLITRCGPKTVTATDAAWDPTGQRFVLTYATRTAGDSTVTGYYQAFRLNGNSASLDGSEVALSGRFPGARGGNAEGHTTDATGQMVIFEETLYESPNYYGAYSCVQVGRDATFFGVRFEYGYPSSNFFNQTECQNNVQTTRTRRGQVTLRH